MGSSPSEDAISNFSAICTLPAPNAIAWLQVRKEAFLLIGLADEISPRRIIMMLEPLSMHTTRINLNGLRKR